MFEGFATTVVETAGAEIFVRYRGEGEPVVLLHGHPRTSATWHKVAPLLVNCGYRVVCADPETWYRPKADAQTMGAENHAELMSAVREPGVVRAMPEDYRAGLALDRVHEEQDRRAGNTLTAPTLILWSQRDDLEALYGDPVAIWQAWASDITGFSIDSHHHMAEEAAPALAAALDRFFSRTA